MTSTDHTLIPADYRLTITPLDVDNFVDGDTTTIINSHSAAPFIAGDYSRGEDAGRIVDALDTANKPDGWHHTVHVLMIDHDGIDSSVHRTEAGAWDALYEYVTEWWDTEHRDGTPIPTDRNAAIDAYFEHVDDEDYSIAPYTIED